MEKRIRTSALPIVMSCPQSKNEPAVSIRDDEEPAHTGSAVHAVLSSRVDGSYAWDIGRACSNWPDVDHDELSMLYAFGLKFWEQYEEFIDVVEVETEHEAPIGSTGWVQTGHMDVAGWYKPFPGCLIIIDWKSGRKETDVRPQTKGYARLLSKKYPEAKWFKLVTVWLRDRRAEVTDLSLAELGDFEEDLISVATSDDYRPGEQCLWCKRRHECRAQTTLTRASAESLLAIDQDESREITPAIIGSLYTRVKLVERACKDYDKVLRNMIDTNGSVPLGDGRIIGFVEEQREKLSVNMDVLLNHFKESNIMDMCSLSKTALKKTIGNVAPPRMEGKMMSAVMDELREAGAVETTTIKKLKITSND